MYEIMKDTLHQALKRMGPNAPEKFSNDMEEGLVTFSETSPMVKSGTISKKYNQTRRISQAELKNDGVKITI